MSDKSRDARDTCLIDYHVHSNVSPDSSAPLRSQIEAALAMGIREIALTDHVEIYPGFHGVSFDYDSYMRIIDRCRDRYAGRITIRAGVEVDFSSLAASKVERFVSSHKFDFVLGSVHYLKGLHLYVEALRQFAAPGRREEFEAVAREYFQEVKEAARSGLFNSLAHLDLLKRYAIPALGSFDVTRYMDQIEEILEAAIEAKTAIEVNTSGLRQAPGEPMPWRPVLERYRAMGGELITVGSDAHRPEDVGFGVRKTCQALAEMGFAGVTTYVQGKPTSLLPLQSPGKRL